MRQQRIALAWALLAALTACRAPAPRPAIAERTPPPDASLPGPGAYDWHALLMAPFGSALKDIPAALHEVLLFRDEAPGSAPTDDAECYAADAPAPRFAGHEPDDYMLCFRHDRLSRIEVSVPLTPAEAPRVFALACAAWQKSALPPAGDAGDAGAACEGRDDATHISGRLGDDARLFIILVGDPNP
jgi:hypothetical protein